MMDKEQWACAIGAGTVFGLIILAGSVALGKVEEMTSFGLIPLLSFLGIVVTKFAEWLYKREDDK